MASPSITAPPIRPPSLDDLVSAYAAGADPVEWLTALKLESPHVNLRALSPWTRTIKRTVDIAGALAAIVLLAPLALVIAVVVRATSKGPAIYRQVRVGLNLRSGPADRRYQPRTPPAEGEVADEPKRSDRRKSPNFGRPFTVYKFRTMVVDAEKHGAQWAAANDSRITTVGRFLRKTRLDEIPQFWNVLRGDMSLVGPRPERVEFIEELSSLIPGYLARLGLRPGISGLAQILNGYDENLESVKRKVALDLIYLQNCCVRNDLKILLRTVKVVLTGKGAR